MRQMRIIRNAQFLFLVTGSTDNLSADSLLYFKISLNMCAIKNGNLSLYEVKTGMAT
jgi:hypothetical protein